MDILILNRDTTFKEKQKRSPFSLTLPSFPQNLTAVATQLPVQYLQNGKTLSREKSLLKFYRKRPCNQLDSWPSLRAWVPRDGFTQSLKEHFPSSSLEAVFKVNKIYEHLLAIINYSNIHYRWSFLYYKSCVKIKHLFFLHQISRTDFFHTKNPASAKRKIEMRLQAEMHPVISIQILYFTVILSMEFPPLDCLQHAKQ